MSAGTQARTMTDDDKRRLGLIDGDGNAIVKATRPALLSRETEAASNPRMSGRRGVREIKSASVLKVILRSIQSQGTGDSSAAAASMNTISLSGCVLRYAGGKWNLVDGSSWHGPVQNDEAHHESFRLPPNIIASYYHDDKRWVVTNPDFRPPPEANGEPSGGGAAADMEQPSRNVPDDVKAFAKRGGLVFVRKINQAIDALVKYYSDVNGSVGNIEKVNLLDDAMNETIGLMVRKEFCSGIVSVLQNGLFTSRLAGLLSFTVWDLIRAASPRPDASSSAAMVTAYRVCRDLNANVNMQHDPHIKTRSFVCASLNHHFLEEWLQCLSA